MICEKESVRKRDKHTVLHARREGDINIWFKKNDVLFIYLFIYFASSLQGTSESYDFGQNFVFIWPKVVYSFLMAKSVVIIRTNINGTL